MMTEEERAIQMGMTPDAERRDEEEGRAEADTGEGSGDSDEGGLSVEGDDGEGEADSSISCFDMAVGNREWHVLFNLVNFTGNQIAPSHHHPCQVSRAMSTVCLPSITCLIYN